MKIIISHDVDHLYPSDHFLKDLIFPKLWIRSLIEFCKGEINLQIFYYRLVSIFNKRLTCIPEIIEFDKKFAIPSVFFFGVDILLGLSYKKKASEPWIKLVLEKGFDAGVHGIEIENSKRMQKEFNDFKAISNLNSFGIRIHYVRYNSTTFSKLADVGYLFDTSELNKKAIELKPSYKIGKMWEFPLHIMDTYITQYKLEITKDLTIKAIMEAEKRGLQYFTFLFHDDFFNGKTYPEKKSYYEWFVNYCRSHNYAFISYKEAIVELERNL